MGWLSKSKEVDTNTWWLRIASNPIFIYNDQDILNSECQGRVVYLPADWNVTHNIFGRAEKLYPMAPNSVFDDYQAARRSPKIVHFAGAINLAERQLRHGFLFLEVRAQHSILRGYYSGHGCQALEMTPTSQSSTSARFLMQVLCVRLLILLHHMAAQGEKPLRPLVEP